MRTGALMSKRARNSGRKASARIMSFMKLEMPELLEQRDVALRAGCAGRRSHPASPGTRRLAVGLILINQISSGMFASPTERGRIKLLDRRVVGEESGPNRHRRRSAPPGKCSARRRTPRMCSTRIGSWVDRELGQRPARDIGRPSISTGRCGCGPHGGDLGEVDVLFEQAAEIGKARALAGRQ